MKLTLIRYKEEKQPGTGDVVTPGLVSADIDGANPIDLVTLEAAWYNNKRGISCLPPGYLGGLHYMSRSCAGP